MVNNLLGDKIKELRLAFNMSQVELSQKLGVTKQCVSNWENDNIVPSVDMLINISKFFKVTTDYLLELTDSDSVSLKGLSDKEKAHIKMLIDDLKNK